MNARTFHRQRGSQVSEARPATRVAIRAWSLRLMVAVLVSSAIPHAGVDSACAGRLARYGGTLRIEVPHLLTDLDPLHLSGDVGAQLAACLYEGMTRWGPDGVEPLLARKWIRSADSRRWVFYLRDDVRFHDGAVCDAAAIQESLHGLADPERSTFVWILRDLVGWEDFAAKRTARIEGIYVVSPTEIELHFGTPIVDFAERLANPAASVVRWQGLVPVGTGPYRAVGAVANALRFMAFPSHRDGRPFLDGIDFVTPDAPGASELTSAARMHRVDPEEAIRPGMRHLRAPAPRLGLVLIHPSSAALRNQNTRRRLSTGFDGSVFVRATLSGDGAAAHGLAPDTATQREPRIEERDGDLLQKPAGRVRILAPAGEPVLKRLGDRLQVHLFALGLEATVQVLAPPAWQAAIRAGSYDVLLVGWTPMGPTSTARGESMRVRDIAARLLFPTFGVHAPEALQQVLASRGAVDEAMLLQSGHVMPLIFFHDTWAVSDNLVDVQLVPYRADLGLVNVHLQPPTP